MYAPHAQGDLALTNAEKLTRHLPTHNQAAILEATDLLDPSSCFLVFFQRGDTQSYREATLAVNNLCGATSTSHRQTAGKETGMQGALVCVDYEHNPSSPRSSDEEQAPVSAVVCLV